MRTDTLERHQAQVCKALQYISANLHRDCTIEELSRVACYAPYHFHRVFREVTGEPVHRYVRRLRLEVSAYHLLFTDDPIIHIAMEAGYQSHEAYTRVFQQVYGLSPSRFRLRSHHSSLRAAARLEGELVRRTWAQRRLAFQPYFGPYAGVAQAWRELGARLVALGVAPDGLQAVGIVHDDPFRCRDIRYDAAVVLSPHLPVDARLGVQVMPEMEVIGARYQGHHVLAPHTYVRMANSWALAGSPRGLRPLPWFEVYERPPFMDGGETVRVDVQAAVA
jgi:AraC family transcriptional regulator